MIMTSTLMPKSSNQHRGPKKLLHLHVRRICQFPLLKKCLRKRPHDKHKTPPDRPHKHSNHAHVQATAPTLNVGFTRTTVCGHQQCTRASQQARLRCQSTTSLCLSVAHRACFIRHNAPHARLPIRAPHLNQLRIQRGSATPSVARPHTPSSTTHAILPRHSLFDSTFFI